MISGIIGRKMGMTQLFAEDGTVTPVTVIKAGPCVVIPVSYTHLRAHETVLDLVCRLLLEKKKKREANN